MQLIIRNFDVARRQRPRCSSRDIENFNATELPGTLLLLLVVVVVERKKKNSKFS